MGTDSATADTQDDGPDPSPATTPIAAAPPVDPPPPADSGAKASTRKHTRRFKPSRTTVLRSTIAALGFAAGAVAGPYAEEVMQRVNPGFFGPDNQAVIDEQKANFEALESKLAALRASAGGDPATLALLNDVSGLVATQKELATQKNELFRATEVENRALREDLLRTRGSSPAVDFWIARGESMVLHDPDRVLSVLQHWSGVDDITINLSGEKHKIQIGDKVEFMTTDGPRVLLYRHGKRASDQRYGFDLARPEQLEGAAAGR